MTNIFQRGWNHQPEDNLYLGGDRNRDYNGDNGNSMDLSINNEDEPVVWVCHGVSGEWGDRPQGWTRQCTKGVLGLGNWYGSKPVWPYLGGLPDYHPQIPAILMFQCTGVLTHIHEPALGSNLRVVVWNLQGVAKVSQTANCCVIVSLLCNCFGDWGQTLNLQWVSPVSCFGIAIHSLAITRFFSFQVKTLQFEPCFNLPSGYDIHTSPWYRWP